MSQHPSIADPATAGLLKAVSPKAHLEPKGNGRIGLYSILLQLRPVQYAVPLN